MKSKYILTQGQSTAITRKWATKNKTAILKSCVWLYIGSFFLKQNFLYSIIIIIIIYIWTITSVESSMIFFYPNSIKNTTTKKNKHNMGVTQEMIQHLSQTWSILHHIWWNLTVFKLCLFVFLNSFLFLAAPMVLFKWSPTFYLKEPSS